MTNRYFDEWLSKFRPSISTYDYYVDFEKVYRNVDEVKIELNLLNSLIGSKDIKTDFVNLLKRYPEILKAIPILLAKRENEIYCQDEMVDFCINLIMVNILRIVIDTMRCIPILWKKVDCLICCRIILLKT